MIEVRGDYVYEVDQIGESHVEMIQTEVIEIRLTVDKQQITANGTETATITANVLDYLGNPRPEYSEDVLFMVNGELHAQPSVSGSATITLTSDAVGTIDVMTVNPSVRNEVVSVYAT